MFNYLSESKCRLWHQTSWPRVFIQIIQHPPAPSLYFLYIEEKGRKWLWSFVSHYVWKITQIMSYYDELDRMCRQGRHSYMWFVWLLFHMHFIHISYHILRTKNPGSLLKILKISTAKKKKSIENSFIGFTVSDMLHESTAIICGASQRVFKRQSKTGLGMLPQMCLTFTFNSLTL